MATVLGASSPTTTCKNVIIVKATAMDRIEVIDSGILNQTKIG